METREVRILGFRYTDAEGIDRMGHKGDVLELSKSDAKRGDANGAFVVPEEELPNPTIGPDSTDGELVAFVEAASPQEVVALAGEHPVLAERLLQAENGATGNDPRPGVPEGLAGVLGHAGGGSTPPEPPAPVDPETPPAAAPPEPVDYSDWKGPDLNAELEKRGIEFKPVGEKNSAKAEKLAADDVAKAQA
jgi:hypothetical protein